MHKERGASSYEQAACASLCNQGDSLVAGRRRDGHPVLLKVDAKRAYEDGVRFYQGNEDIYLADPIGAGYLIEVEY